MTDRVEQGLKQWEAITGRKRKTGDPSVPDGYKRCRRCTKPFKKSRADATVNCPSCRRELRP